MYVFVVIMETILGKSPNFLGDKVNVNVTLSMLYFLVAFVKPFVFEDNTTFRCYVFLCQGVKATLLR